MHPWEVYEITLTAQSSYEHPYTEVEVWVDLTGPDFARRVYGFWRGGAQFAVRVTATAPGVWSWRSGANVADAGLVGQQGSFVAAPWSPAELDANPLRRGFLTATPNGRAIQHADGTPCFLLGDTWWSVGTWRYPWREDDDDHGLGPDMGLKEMVRYRKRQGLNCIAVIASLHAWADDGRPAHIVTDAGIAIRSAWRNRPTGSAKSMHNSAGERPFAFPGRVPGYEDVYPDMDSIVPTYFDELDTKISYLNSQGFVVFLEPTRRDHSMAWMRYYSWPDSWIRFVQYIWRRYGAHNVILSPIHLDYLAASIPAKEYRLVTDQMIEQYGMPPFCQLISANPHETARRNFGDDCQWLTLHMAGNGERYHNRYEAFVGGDFRSWPTKPCLNGEPHYAGWYEPRGGSKGGTPDDDLDMRSAMYGSVLCGGLAGHIYGANYLWEGEVEDQTKEPMWQSIQWQSGGQLQHLRAFVTSIGDSYMELEPCRELVSPSESGPGNGFRGWAFCAATEDRRVFLVYLEPGCRSATLSGALPGAAYDALTFDPATGEWSTLGDGIVAATPEGAIALPATPSDADLAIRFVAR